MSLNLGCNLINKSSSCCCYSMSSVEPSFLFFVCCWIILFGFVLFVKETQQWGWDLRFSLFNGSAIAVLHLSRMRYKFWKLYVPLSTVIHFLAYVLRFQWHYFWHFFFAFKMLLYNQHTSDCGWSISIRLSTLGKHNIENIAMVRILESRNECKVCIRFTA